MLEKVQVIMRSKNSDWVIDDALAGLFSQEQRDFELLVVDSGSTDRTLEIVARYPHRLIRIEAGDYYPGRVLNMAIEATTAELLVFQNSDVVPLDPHALDRLLAPFEDPAVVATFARQLPRPEAHSWVRRDYDAAFPAEGSAPPWITYSLPFAAMRRTAWREHAFYQDAWGSEDVEWGHWAIAHGHVVRYVPESRVMHSHNYTLRQLYGRRFIEGEADAFIYRDRQGLGRALVRFMGSVANDVLYHARIGDWSGLARAPARRAVYHWAYLKGHRLGEGRIASGNTDGSIGQRVVLERHDSIKGS